MFYSALAADESGICGSTAEECSWKFDPNTYHLTCSGNGKMPDFTYVKLPPWNSIHDEIIKVTIEGFTSIGDYAFYYCRSLKEVTIPNSVTSIGTSAFSLCSSLQSIEIPNSVTFIGVDVFSHCSSLTSIVIPDNVNFIGEYSFYYCSSLQSVTIPNSVTSIEDATFYECKSLKSISIPNKVSHIGFKAFSSCASLQDITIPDSVTTIENNAFSSCTSLRSVTIPNGVESISYGTFSSCTSLQKITIPDSVTTIENNAFSYCSSLQSIAIPNSVTLISYSTFESCTSLQKITIPDSVTTIGESAFSSCPLLQVIEVSFTSQLNSVKYNAFSDCPSLKTLLIKGNGLMKDYTEANYQNAPWVKLSPFIKKIVIENGITSIGDYSFYQMSNFETILIPETITLIGINSLSEIPTLKTVYYGGTTKPQCESDYSTSGFNVKVTSSFDSESKFCFKNVEKTGFEGICGENCNWKVDSTFNLLTIDGSGVMNDFANDEQPWSVYKETLNKVGLNGITSIGNYAFYGTLFLETITSNVQYFGSHSFENSGIESVVIGNGIDSNVVVFIGEYAFNKCYNLKSVEIKTNFLNYPNDDSKKSCSIQRYAFADCSNVESFIIDGYVDEVKEYAFFFKGLNQIVFEYKTTSSPKKCSSYGKDLVIQPIFSNEMELINVPKEYNSRVFCACDKLGCPKEYVDLKKFDKIEKASTPVSNPSNPGDSSSQQNDNDNDENGAIINAILIAFVLILTIN